jgi:hypothetical protein
MHEFAQSARGQWTRFDQQYEEDAIDDDDSVDASDNESDLNQDAPQTPALQPALTQGTQGVMMKKAIKRKVYPIIPIISDVLRH